MTTIDSNPESNLSDFKRLRGIPAGSIVKLGQAFTAPISATLTQSKFYLEKFGNPTGNITSSLYACTGSPGSTGKPADGSIPLVTSNNVDVSTLGLSYSLITFTFSVPYNIISGTDYVITVEYSGGDGSNFAQAGTSFETHPGNLCQAVTYNPNNWATIATYDVIFYVIGTSTNTLTVTMSGGGICGGAPTSDFKFSVIMSGGGVGGGAATIDITMRRFIQVSITISRPHTVVFIDNYIFTEDEQ